MPVFTCTYSDRSKTAEIEAKNFEEAAEEFARKYPSQVKLIYIKNFVWGRKTLPNPGAEDFRKKANEKKAQKQKAKEEALAHIIQKVTDGDAERLSYDEINAVVENFFAHEESFRKEEADLRCRLYALTLTNSTLQGLIQTTILSRLISGNSSNGAGATTSGGNSMGKALVAASLLNNQQLKGMAEDVEDISEGFGLDEE
jgi:hypothetical protein